MCLNLPIDTQQAVALLNNFLSQTLTGITKLSGISVLIDAVKAILVLAEWLTFATRTLTYVIIAYI